MDIVFNRFILASYEDFQALERRRRYLVSSQGSHTIPIGSILGTRSNQEDTRSGRLLDFWKVGHNTRNGKGEATHGIGQIWGGTGFPAWAIGQLDMHFSNACFQ